MTPLSQKQLDPRTHGGELGRLIRAKDWSSTPLGPIETWPQSLRTSVDLILDSQHPMWIGWGPEMTFLYNDAYIPVLSMAKHPWALGRPTIEVWSEIYDVVGPLSDKVFRLGEATFLEDVRLFMNRGSFIEETYFSFSYSPIRDETGRVAGLFCPSTETSLRVVNARRLRTLSSLSSQGLSQQTTSDACREVAHVLAQNTDDVPFSFLYLVDGDSDAVLQHVSGVDAVPERARLVPLGEAAEPAAAFWPIAPVLQSGRMRVVEVPQELAVVSHAGQRVREAVVLPLAAHEGDSVGGALVLGVSPARRLDSEYRAFLDLVAAQTAGAIHHARASETEKERADALAALDRAKSAFFSNVSHEFRTPLTLLIGPTEDALASPERSLGGPALESVYRNELRLLKLVNAILDFSRVEAGQTRAHREPTDLARATREIASAFETAFARAGIALEVETASDLPTVSVDRDMWEKIVLNLLSNALKFTFEGSVRVSLERDENTLLLVVADTGTGIAADELPRLFERFHRVEGAKARTHEGSGIGLALAHELVKLHGGTIDVTSELGRGTTFHVRLPFDARATDQIPVPRAAVSRSIAQAYVAEAMRWLPSPEPIAPAATDGVRILVADDNADMRDYVAGLVGARWHVDRVSDGRQALERLRAQRYDLVLSDVMMPELDGFGLLAAMKSDPSLRAIPVIMLSARAGEEASVEGLQAGADDYLVKPFSARELVARVETRLELARARAATEKARARISDHLMQAPVPVCVVSAAELRFEMANPAYVTMMGGREVTGKTLTEAFPELPGQNQVFSMFERVAATGETYQDDELRVMFDLSGSGRLVEHFYQLTCQPMRAADGTVEAMMVVAVDVTEQVLARRHLEGARAEAEQANRSKDEFLALLGHELRNPLAPIVTAIELMQRKGNDLRELSIVSRQIGHLTRLVDDLLDVSRITRKKISLHKRPLELDSVVASAVEMVAPLLDHRRQTLDVRVPAEGLTVVGDHDRLAQVFSNLLSNAAKYSEKGARIQIVGDVVGDQARIQVVDRGQGIAPDLIEKVFDLFFQPPQALDRQKGGLGLGLAIVRNLTELHGGTVSASSEGEGKGSTFTVMLPTIGDTVPTPSAPRVSSSSRQAEDKPRRRVLIVDDNQDAAEMLGEYLERGDFHVRTAFDAPSALDIAADFSPDVCLLDIGLPVMNGFELARHLREREGETRKLKLVAVTGYGQDHDRKRSSEAGFDVHLVKPVNLDEVLRVCSA